MSLKGPHPLRSSWTFWYSPRGRNSAPESSKNYEVNLTNLGTCKTAEEFFSYYCHLRKPSEILNDHKMIIFREGLKPCWEEWPEGGCWILQVKKKEESWVFNSKWEKLIFSLVAEEMNQIVIGIVLSVRHKKNLIEIWLSSVKDENQMIKVGEKIREILDLEPEKLVFYFKEHQKSLLEGSTLKGVDHYYFITTPNETPVGTPSQIKSKLETGMKSFEL